MWRPMLEVAAANVYLVLGSRHEEARLLRAYGDRYEAYQQSGVPFYASWPGPAVLEEPTATLAGPHRNERTPKVNAPTRPKRKWSDD